MYITSLTNNVNSGLIIADNTNSVLIIIFAKKYVRGMLFSNLFQISCIFIVGVAIEENVIRDNSNANKQFYKFFNLELTIRNDLR